MGYANTRGEQSLSELKKAIKGKEPTFDWQLDRIVEAYDSVRVALRGEQGQRNATVRSLDEWNAFPDEDRDDISLFHNVANSVGDRSLEHYTLGLASKVHTHELAESERDSCTKILRLRDVKCKPFPMGSCFSGSSRRNPYLHLNLCEGHERKLGLIR